MTGGTAVRLLRPSTAARPQACPKRIPRKRTARSVHVHAQKSRAAGRATSEMRRGPSRAIAGAIVQLALASTALTRALTVVTKTSGCNDFIGQTLANLDRHSVACDAGQVPCNPSVDKVMAYIVMAYIVMPYIVMDDTNQVLQSFCADSADIVTAYNYGISNYGLYSYALYTYWRHKPGPAILLWRLS